MTAVALKTEADIAQMRAAGQVVGAVLAAVSRAVLPGVSTAEIDALAADVLKQHGATSPFLGYHNRWSPDKPFPAHVCTSVNDALVHGVPRPDDVLAAGDIITVDVGAICNGWVADSAWTFAVGDIAPETRDLLDATRSALYTCISVATAGNTTGDIAETIRRTVEQRGYSVVRDFPNHGVGRSLHEDPLFDSYGAAGTGTVLQAGMTLALEPMVLSGAPDVYVDAEDGWTICADDGAPTAHFEHTIVITSGEAEILTHWSHD